MIQTALNLGDKVELTKKADFIETDTYYSMIYEINDEYHMVIQAPIESGRIIPLETETTYYACVYTKRGLYRGEVEVIRRIKDKNLHYLELRIITPLKKYQRRQYYRMNCVFNFNYKDNEQEIWHKGTLLDISGGGIRFSTSVKMEVEKTVNCHLELHLRDNSIDVYVDGIVIQSKPIEPELVHYQNRIRFLELSLDDREKIIKFIFEEERRQRKKEKGL